MPSVTEIMLNTTQSQHWILPQIKQTFSPKLNDINLKHSKIFSQFANVVIITAHNY